MTFRSSPFSPLRIVAASLLAVAGLVLSGCAGGSSPQASGTPSSSASESASPSPTQTPVYKPADAKGRAENVPVPVLPVEAKAETKEGLEAFTKYWYSTLSYAYETGDMKPLEAISGSACASCQRVREVVDGWHSEGRWIVGGKMIVQAAQSNFVETGPSEYQAVAQVYQETLSYYRADGSMAEETKRKPAIADIMIAVHDGSRWTANTVEHISNDK